MALTLRIRILKKPLKLKFFFLNFTLCNYFLGVSVLNGHYLSVI